MLGDFFSRREVSHSPEGSRGKRTGGQLGGDKPGKQSSTPGWGVLAQYQYRPSLGGSLKASDMSPASCDL